MATPMMKCGHSAAGTCARQDGQVFDPPIPACVICSCIEVAEAPPDLTGRIAECSYNGSCRARYKRERHAGIEAPDYGTFNETGKATAPSSPELPFFEYCGPGSNQAEQSCKRCGFYKVAHEMERRGPDVCGRFEPKGDTGIDKFYCGCFGWD